MGYAYDDAIAVTRVAPGRYSADIDAGWTVGGGVNGGYCLSVVGNAIRQETTAHPDPYTISAYYLSATRPGAATVRVEVLRAGRGSTTVRATLSQSDGGVEVDRITALATYGSLAGLTGEVATTAQPPDLPPIDECVVTSDAPAEIKEFVPMLDRMALRLDPACGGATFRTPSGRALIQGWFALVDARPLDPIALLTAVDAMPPVTFELGRFGWAPTLELTVHVRAEPAPGPVRLRHESRNLATGFFEEDAEVWDSAGRLVAQSRQLALLPRPTP